MFIIIVFWKGRDRLSGLCFFMPALPFSIVTPLFFFVLFHSCSSHARVFGKTLVHEFPLSYLHTEWYLLFSRNEMIEMIKESPVKKLAIIMIIIIIM